MGKEIAKQYALKLKAEKFPFKAIYLFGSHAKGGVEEWSDIDIAVVSNRLKRDWNENGDLLWKFAVSVDPRIEPVGFAVDDFEIEDDPLVREIKKTGIKVDV
jgi:predicted nucleotidyltransferase